MDTSGAARLAKVMKVVPKPAVLGLDQTPRMFRLGIVTASAPLTIMFNNDPAAVVSELPVLNSYVGVVDDMVVVAVIEGGGMVVLGTVNPPLPTGGVPGALPWGVPWGIIGGAVDATSRGSSGSSGAGQVVFPTVNFTCVANRIYKVSWHASYVQNTDAGASTLIVQFAHATSVVIQNAAVQTVLGGWTGPLDAFMYVWSNVVWTPGPAGVQVIATATAPAGFAFQVGTYGSYMIVEDVGPATAAP